VLVVVARTSACPWLDSEGGVAVGEGSVVSSTVGAAVGEAEVAVDSASAVQPANTVVSKIRKLKIVCIDLDIIIILLSLLCDILELDI
jgi:hypothetical protein